MVTFWHSLFRLRGLVTLLLSICCSTVLNAQLRTFGHVDPQPSVRSPSQLLQHTRGSLCRFPLQPLHSTRRLELRKLPWTLTCYIIVTSPYFPYSLTSDPYTCTWLLGAQATNDATANHTVHELLLCFVSKHPTTRLAIFFLLYAVRLQSHSPQLLLFHLIVVPAIYCLRPP